MLAYMSPLATLILGWAAVYSYVCLYYCALYHARPRDREYLCFGLLCGALALYAVASAVFTDARTVVEGAFAMRLTFVGMLAAVAFFVDFCEALTVRRSRLSTVAYVWALLGLAGIAAGLFVDPTRAGPPPTWGFAGAPDYPEATVTVLGQIDVATAVLLAGVALARMRFQARNNREVRILLLAAAVDLAASAHDVLIRMGSLRSVYLFEHTAVIAVLAMSYVLLERFVRTGEELGIRTDELRHSYDELRQAQEEIVRKEQLAAVGELSAVIAHEVRNPLAIIKNAASGLRRTAPDSDDHVTLLGILDEETQRLHRLVDDLLAYTRPVSLEANPIDLVGLVHEAVEHGRDGASAAHVEVVLELDQAPPELRGDADLLHHALVNIVDNALQAMPAGGTLTVEARPAALGDQAAVALAFRDTGEGMDSLVREKARAPFFTTRPSGTGLGLAMVDRVVRTHGGSVEIESRHGIGTVVTVILPVGPPPTLKLAPSVAPPSGLDAREA